MAAKVLVGMPTRDYRCHAGAMWAAEQMAHVANVDAEFFMPGKFNVTSARNNCVRRLLAGDYTHLMFVDDDTIVPPHALDTMLHIDVDIVSACTPSAQNGRAIPNVLPAGSLGREWSGQWFTGVIDIERCGLACCLIRRQVFETLKHPWFTWIEADDGRELGEDIYFADRAREAGFAMKATGDVRCGHFSTVNLLQFAQDDRYAARAHKTLRIVGHSRSGTGYMAALLYAYGLQVGHESMGADGISSWMFVPEHAQAIPWRIERIAPCNYSFEHTIHVVRNPLDAIASIAAHECGGTGVLGGARTDDAKQEVEAFRAAHCLIYMAEPPIVRAVQSYIGWNRLCEALKPDVRIRVEHAPQELDKWLQGVGPLARPRYGELPPTNVNAIPHDSLTWRDIYKQVPRSLIAELVKMTGDYGYGYDGA